MRKSKILILIMVIIMLILSSCDKSKYLLVNLITKSETSEVIEYVAIYPNQDSKNIDKFKSDNFQTYNSDSSCFVLDGINNKFVNRLNKISIEDSKGNDVEIDEIITGIFESAQRIDHDIWQLQIFKMDDKYFALVKLNVNWQSPCDFYEYNITDKTLNLLKRFEGVDVIGISLPKDPN